MLKRSMVQSFQENAGGTITATAFEWDVASFAAEMKRALEHGAPEAELVEMQVRVAAWLRCK